MSITRVNFLRVLIVMHLISTAQVGAATLNTVPEDENRVERELIVSRFSSTESES